MKIWFRVSLTPLRIVCLARTRTRPGWLGQAIRLFNIVHICQKLAKAVSPKSSAPSPFPPPQLWPPPPPPPQPAPPPSAMQRQGWPRMRNRLISHSAPPRFPSPLAFSGLFLFLSLLSLFFDDVMSIDWIDGLYASFFLFGFRLRFVGLLSLWASAQSLSCRCTALPLPPGWTRCSPRRPVLSDGFFQVKVVAF